MANKLHCITALHIYDVPSGVSPATGCCALIAIPPRTVGQARYRLGALAPANNSTTPPESQQQSFSEQTTTNFF